MDPIELKKQHQKGPAAKPVLEAFCRALARGKLEEAAGHLAPTINWFGQQYSLQQLELSGLSGAKAELIRPVPGDLLGQLNKLEEVFHGALESQDQSFLVDIRLNNRVSTLLVLLRPFASDFKVLRAMDPGSLVTAIGQWQQALAAQESE